MLRAKRGRTGFAVVNTSFMYNEVTHSGGAIFFDTEKAYPNSYHNLYIINSTFENNHADKSGGAIYWNNLPPITICDNAFVGNKADEHAPDIGTYPIAMLLKSIYDRWNPIKEPFEYQNVSSSISDLYRVNERLWREHSTNLIQRCIHIFYWIRS